MSGCLPAQVFGGDGPDPFPEDDTYGGVSSREKTDSPSADHGTSAPSTSNPES